MFIVQSVLVHRTFGTHQTPYTGQSSCPVYEANLPRTPKPRTPEPLTTEPRTQEPCTTDKMSTIWGIWDFTT